MTPNDIEVLLHYYLSPYPHEREDAPAVQGAIESFLIRGILKIQLEEESCFNVTKKGRKLIEMLCNTPDPIQIWDDPRDISKKD